MTWPAFLQIARVRAVEETDAEGRVWDAELRRAVTREAGQAGRNPLIFLQRRATILAAKAHHAAVLGALRVPAVPSWITGPGWLLAFVFGWSLAAVGQESEINLLALPLLGILLWNAAVVLLSLCPSRRAEPQADDWRETLLRCFTDKRSVADDDRDSAGTALTRFNELVRVPTVQRFAIRLKLWLHVAAALLALGSISAMYARGWSKEYRAVWESTLLDESGAEKFFRVLFSPASAVTGQAVPLKELPGMRRRADEPAAKPGDALPWIHLYVATLGLFVVVPRGLLILLELSRVRAVPRRALQDGDWTAHAQRLRSLVEGAGAPALILTHGLKHDAEAQDRWRHWAYLHWRDLGHLDFESVPVGGETEFAKEWLPAAPRVMLVFNMAAVPEAEVQRALVSALVDKLRSSRDMAVPLLLALDDSDLRRRWSGFGDLSARLAERAAAWSDAMQGSGMVWHELMMPAQHAKP